MTDETNTETQVDGLSLLKNRARLMGITFSNNIGFDALKEKIDAKLNGPVEAKADALEANPLIGETSPPVRVKTAREDMFEREMKLVRLRITNMDPKKKDLPGEILTVGNEVLGIVRKYVPFGEVTEDGYHVPHILYTFMKERKFLNVRITKGPNGKQIVRHNWAPEFSLEVLPQLTQSQLDKLGAAQQAAGVFANDEQF